MLFFLFSFFEPKAGVYSTGTGNTKEGLRLLLPAGSTTDFGSKSCGASFPKYAVCEATWRLGPPNLAGAIWFCEFASDITVSTPAIGGDMGAARTVGPQPNPAPSQEEYDNNVSLTPPATQLFWTRGRRDIFSLFHHNIMRAATF